MNNTTNCPKCYLGLVKDEAGHTSACTCKDGQKLARWWKRLEKKEEAIGRKDNRNSRRRIVARGDALAKSRGEK